MAKAAESKKNIESLGQLSLPPHSSDAEAALIGGLLLDSENQAYDKIADIVSERDFYHTENKEVFTVIQSLSEESKVSDLLTVSDYLDSSTDFESKPSIEYLSEIVESTAGNSNITEYAKIIREKALLRELIQISSEIAQSAYKPEGKSPSELVDIAESHIFEIAERGNRNMVFAEMSDLVKQTYDELDKRSQGGGKITGVSSGFRELDNLTAGLQNGELIIIAGRPSMGKTALATNIAFHAAKNIERKGVKSTVAFFSLEMSSEQLATRILSEQSKIRSNDIRRGKVSESEFEKFIETSKNIYDLPLYIDETPAITIAAISNRARRIKRLFGLELIVVDYIQLMTSSRKKEYNRVQEISEITQGLKALAKELDVPVLALSQLSRAVEQRDNKKPQLADLRESGSIEQDADVVMFVYRESYYL